MQRKRRRSGSVGIGCCASSSCCSIYGLSFGAAACTTRSPRSTRTCPQDLTKLLEYQPNRKSIVLSSDGEEIGAFSIENRRIVPLDRMPPHVPAAFLSAEDRRFFKHPGFDPVGIVRAAWKNFRSTGIKQGGSTITQQIIKQTMLPARKATSPTSASAERSSTARRRRRSTSAR